MHGSQVRATANPVGTLALYVYVNDVVPVPYIQRRAQARRGWVRSWTLALTVFAAQLGRAKVLGSLQKRKRTDLLLFRA